MLRTIVEERSKNIVVLDVFSKLAQDRIVVVDGLINDELANNVIFQLMYLDSVSNEEITIIINSPGGYVYQGLGIIDVMRIIKSPVKTQVIGEAMSMAAIILACGDKRQSTKLATIMFHQPSGEAFGTFTEVETSYQEIKRLKDVLYDIIKEKTNIENPEEAFNKDTFYTAQTAKDLNIIDEIL